MTTEHPGLVSSARRHRLASSDSEAGAQVHSVLLGRTAVPAAGYTDRETRPELKLLVVPAVMTSQRTTQKVGRTAENAGAQEQTPLETSGTVAVQLVGGGVLEEATSCYPCLA